MNIIYALVFRLPNRVILKLFFKEVYIRFTILMFQNYIFIKLLENCHKWA
jgi:hypothetical protein